MGKTNGRSETGNTGLDIGARTPASDNETETSTNAVGRGIIRTPQSELQKLKRSGLVLDACAHAGGVRNVVRRNAKEQQEFRDYAAADAIKPCRPCSIALSAPSPLNRRG